MKIRRKNNGKQVFYSLTYDLIMGDIEVSCYIPVTLSTCLAQGQPSGIPAIIWETIEDISFFPANYTDGITGKCSTKCLILLR